VPFLKHTRKPPSCAGQDDMAILLMLNQFLSGQVVYSYRDIGAGHPAYRGDILDPGDTVLLLQIADDLDVLLRQEIVRNIHAISRR